MKTLGVFPTSRALREKTKESKEAFLPQTTTMQEFISNICVVDGFGSVDGESRTIILLEAADFEAFRHLKIDRNFFKFTKNAPYIFALFQELSAEEYDIKDLSNHDIYGDYEEHISILQELYKRFEELCMRRKIVEPIFTPKLYRLNKPYLKSFDAIEIFVDGYLTNFELRVLLECASQCDIFIHLNTTRFNTKLQTKFASLGFELSSGFSYKLHLNKRKILEKKALRPLGNIVCYSLSEETMQVAFVKKKVYEFIQQGYSPDKIAIILPNEKFAQKLKLFDEKLNFNFAMGFSFAQSVLFQELDAAIKCLDLASKENLHRVARLGKESYDELFNIYFKKDAFDEIIAFLERFSLRSKSKNEKQLFDGEIYSFNKLRPYIENLNTKSLFALFMQRASKATMDDIMGGKITVMGLLESRHIEFDAVIVVDFSDAFVPKRSDKDMFLNTALRKAANLPTPKDREDLQRYYYEMLFRRSKEVAISFSTTSQSEGSMFLKQLGIRTLPVENEANYASLLFRPSTHTKQTKEPIVLDYSFKDKKLSATKLKTFLECKRRYYYRYEAKIQPHSIPKDISKEHEIGVLLHLGLKNLYTKQNSFNNKNELTNALGFELDALAANDKFQSYQLKLYKKRLESFCANEIDRFSQGYEVFGCELPLSGAFYGAQLEGNIDRIDKKDGKLYVLDYKSGSINSYTEKTVSEATDFQLEFYYLLASQLGTVSECGYYDLQNGKIINESLLEQKLDLLRSIITDLQTVCRVDFEMCNDLSRCRFCDYATICQRA